MRIARLAAENPRTQGPERRAWYARHSPAHLRAVAALLEDALAARGPGAPATAVVLGAGACTELPLERLARVCRSVLLVDVDVAGMLRARDALQASLRARVDVVQADLTGGVSDALAADLAAQPWPDLARLGQPPGIAAVESAAACLERCPIPDPPTIEGLTPGSYGLVLSTLVLTQLYSLPLLDVLDRLNYAVPWVADVRETLPRYVTAAQTFRRRIARSHLTLVETLLAPDGAALLVSDRVGMLLPPRSGPHARDPRERLEVLPRDVLAFPEDLAARFALVGASRSWEWTVDLPDTTRPGRAFEVVGVVFRCQAASAERERVDGDGDGDGDGGGA